MAIIEKRRKQLESIKQLNTASKDMKGMTSIDKFIITYGDLKDYIDEIEYIQWENQTYGENELIELRSIYQEINSILNQWPILSWFKIFCCYTSKQPSDERKQFTLTQLEAYNETSLEGKSSKDRGNTELIMKYRHKREDKITLEDTKHSEAGKLLQRILDSNEKQNKDSIT